ncbi:hypothetical protein EYF80_008081 [Liparis tanakae]|uniref:Uncharacterized protein n=1 Tax=Liparis tanakae TaxID=230148 RepID=A0A4Z2IUN1_9TELE|nr:hypothetical protein EYF80_008081 [Liparis tanakae]
MNTSSTLSSEVAEGETGSSRGLMYSLPCEDRSLAPTLPEATTGSHFLDVREPGLELTLSSSTPVAEVIVSGRSQQGCWMWRGLEAVDLLSSQVESLLCCQPFLEALQDEERKGEERRNKQIQLLPEQAVVYQSRRLPKCLMSQLQMISEPAQILLCFGFDNAQLCVDVLVLQLSLVFPLQLFYYLLMGLFHGSKAPLTGGL